MVSDSEIEIAHTNRLKIVLAEQHRKGKCLAELVGNNEAPISMVL